MRYLGLMLLVGCGLSACQSHKTVEKQQLQTGQVVSTLDQIDYEKRRFFGFI